MDSEKFEQLLRSTGREGVEGVIEWLRGSDFYRAPASTVFHGNYVGGLLEHSGNCYVAGMKLRELYVELRPELARELPVESVTLVTLLHDVCKVNVYKGVVKNQKVNGVWVEVPGYTVDYSELPLGHGEKSVVLLLRLGLRLTDEELMAIRWHMGAWDLPFQSIEHKSSQGLARDIAPLCTLMQQADGLASGVLELKR